MSWSLDFRAALVQGLPRRHRVRSVPWAAGDALSLGEEWVLSSERQSHGLTIASGGSTAGAELAVGDWTTTIGTWRVPLVGMPGPLLRRIRRGQLVVHEVGFPGWADSRWQVVQIGSVASFDGEPGRWTLTLRDIVSTLRSRITRTVTSAPLFHDLPLTGTLAAGYTAGDATLTVSALPSPSVIPTGGSGMVRMRPDTDSEFRLLFTGTTTGPNRLTGVSTAVLGTTATNVANGSTIAYGAYLEDEPAEIAAQILTSTGGLGNGPYDVLPAAWGLGLPQEYLDVEDLRYWRDYVKPSSGVGDWVLVSDEEQPEGIRYVAAWLARGGLFPIQRQGALTVRAAVNPAGVTSTLASESVTFGRLSGDLVVPGSIRWSAWGGGFEEPREGIIVTSAGSGAGSGDATFEAQDGLPYREADEDQHDLSDTLWSNQTAQRDAIMDRLLPWECRSPERLELDTTHPLAAGLCPGDIVTLHLSYFGGRAEWQTGAYDGRPAMVVRVDPDIWGGGPTSLVLAVAPNGAAS